MILCFRKKKSSML